MDHHRGGPSAQAVRLISVADTGSLWTRRFLRHHAYVLAVLSILLPAAFLAFGIAVTFADGKPVPSQWHLVWKLADVLSTAWPIILAAVAVQCLVSWMTLRAKRCQAEHIESGNVPEQAFNRSQIEAICLFLFFGLTIAPVGSLALRNVFGTGFATHHSPVDVWYIDRTGQNALWSESPTSTLSTTSRQELIQTVGEKYARDLLLDINSQNPGESFSYATTIAPMNSRIFLRSSILQTERQNNETPSSALASDQNATVPSTITLTHQIMLDLTTSYLDFVCGAWNLKIRDFEDFTTPGEMSYSSSQTLGMSMAASSGNAEFPTGNVTIASLNKITENGLLALDESWEYSTIQCTWTQLFYNAPVQCDWDDNVGLSNCVQYAESQLLLNPGGVSGTPLQDFANDFVLSGNIPTAERIATASKYSNLIAHKPAANTDEYSREVHTEWWAGEHCGPLESRHRQHGIAQFISRRDSKPICATFWTPLQHMGSAGILPTVLSGDCCWKRYDSRRPTSTISPDHIDFGRSWNTFSYCQLAMGSRHPCP